MKSEAAWRNQQVGPSTIATIITGECSYQLGRLVGISEAVAVSYYSGKRKNRTDQVAKKLDDAIIMMQNERSVEMARGDGWAEHLRHSKAAWSAAKVEFLANGRRLTRGRLADIFDREVWDKEGKPRGMGTG